MNIALVADWLTTYGGAERVLTAIHQLYPKAPFYTSVKGRGTPDKLSHTPIYTTRLQWLYRLLKHHQLLIPWLPRTMETIDLHGYDVVISSSHAVGKGIIPQPNSVHICYCHTPMRYAWLMQDAYLQDFHLPRFLWRLARKKLNAIRRWDMTTAKRVDVFIANSSETQARIRQIYGRESVVIPPPVEDRFFHTPLRSPQTADYYIAVGRLIPYKRFDLLIDVANRLQLPLKIVGTGQELQALKKRAGPTVEFLGFVPDKDLPSLIANAKGYLFPQIEDAGITLLEALASGTPAIAFNAGGAKDAITPDTGMLFESQTVDSLAHAIVEFEKRQWNRPEIRSFATTFSEKSFGIAFKKAVDDAYTTYKHPRA